jgi:hypothetical protein
VSLAVFVGLLTLHQGMVYLWYFWPFELVLLFVRYGFFGHERLRRPQFCAFGSFLYVPEISGVNELCINRREIVFWYDFLLESLRSDKWLLFFNIFVAPKRSVSRENTYCIVMD